MKKKTEIDDAMLDDNIDEDAADEAIDESIATENIVDAIEDTLEKQLADCNDRYTRQLAEFDNYRKRTFKEMTSRYDDGVRSVCENLLPVIDNFERALSANEDPENKFYQGILMIARQFEAVLSDLGIKPIEIEPGMPFDHNLHHAVAHAEDENFGPNEITAELQKGYMHRDKVLRHSMVKVAN